MTAAERLSAYRPTPVRFSADEFMTLAQHPPVSEWAGKIELLEGEIVRMAPANIPHWRVHHATAQQLGAVFRELGDDWVVGPEPTVRFADRTIRVPDIGVFRRPDLTRSTFQVADLFLAVEVADTSLRIDMGSKLISYAEARIAHYWIIDLNARTTLVMDQPGSGKYLNRTAYAFGDAISVPGTDATIVVA